MINKSPDSNPVPFPRKLESRLFLAAKILLGVCVGLSLASVFLLTVELDEAWIFGPTQQWVAGVWADPGRDPALTSGGLHFVLQALASLLGGSEHYSVRIVSVGYFILLAAALSVLFDSSRQARNGTLILLATILSVPGVLLHCSLAFSAVLATALFFVTLNLWLRHATGSIQRRLFTGLVLGLTVATRFNMLAVIPVLIAFSLRRRDRQAGHLSDAVIVSGIAIATLLASHVVQTSISSPSSGLTEMIWLMSKVSGLWDKSALVKEPLASGNGIWSYLQLWIWLDRWQLATQQFPLWIMLLSTAYAWVPLGKVRSSHDTRILQLIAAFGWVSWLAWLVLSPLPWYRYLLPSLIGFAAIVGHLVIQLHLIAVQHRKDLAFIVPLFLVANLVSSAVIGVRHLRLGNSGRIVREYSGVTGLTNHYYMPFAAERQQRELVAFIREKSDEDVLVAIASRESGHLLLAFRSGRRLMKLEEAMRAKLDPQWIIVPPSGLNDEARNYLGSRYRVNKRIGPHVILQEESIRADQ